MLFRSRRRDIHIRRDRTVVSPGSECSPIRRLTVPGALVAAVIWMALSQGLGFFFHHFGTRKLDMFYGIPTTLIALVVWLYWSANAILIGAQINVSLQHYKRPVSSDATES